MRIKFRAWDKKKKQLLRRPRISFVNGNDFVINRAQPGELFDYGAPSEFDLLQFTDLLDEDNKEIYVGDILEDHFWNGMWFTKLIEVKMPDIWSRLDEHRDMKGSYFKVVGNIYENPKMIAHD